MAQDPIVAEVRKYRDQYAKRFEYDLRAIYLDLKEKQEKSKRQRVVLPPRRVELTEASGLSQP
jgi:hypothetical protein